MDKGAGQHGPSIPVTMHGGTKGEWDCNDHRCFSWQMSPNSRGESTRKYIHFTVYNNERGCNPFCPGVRYNGRNTEHACIGTGGYMPEGVGKQCSDFSGWDWNGVRGNGQSGAHWSV